jgi:glycosyltransferase involved in cell wall biosynthesis
MLDYLWAGLPIVCTRGDVLSEVIDRNELGFVVGYRNVAAVATALDTLANEDALRRQERRLRLRLESDRRRWSLMAEPLVEFCREPALAADRRNAEPVHHGLRWRLGLVVRAIQAAIRG